MVKGLGLSQYGIYSVSFSLVSLGSYLDLGLTWSTAKFVAEADKTNEPGRVGIVLLASIIYQFGVSIFFAAIVLVGGDWISATVLAMPSDLIAITTAVLRLTAISFLVSSLASVFVSGLRGMRRFAAATLISSTATTISVVGASIVAFLGYGVIAAASAQLAGVLFGLACSYIACRTFVGRAQFGQPVWAQLRSMLGFSIWNYITRLFQMLALNADKIVLTRWAGPAVLPFYAVPFNFCQRINFLAGPAVSSIFPVAAIGRTDPEAFIRQYLSASRLVHVTTAAAAISILVWGGRFLGAWIGPEMQLNGHFFLTALTVGFWLVSVGSFDGGCIEGWNYPRRTCLISALAILAGLAVLASTWSSLGAAKSVALGVATYFSLAGIGQAIVWYFMARYPLAFQLKHVALPIAEMGLIAIVAEVVLEPRIQGRIAVIVTLFALMALLGSYGIWRAFSRDELRALTRRVLGKRV
jgi:O-antigen/teichoic acid export membrane protein